MSLDQYLALFSEEVKPWLEEGYIAYKGNGISGEVLLLQKNVDDRYFINVELHDLREYESKGCPIKCTLEASLHLETTDGVSFNVRILNKLSPSKVEQFSQKLWLAMDCMTT